MPKKRQSGLGDELFGTQIQVLKEPRPNVRRRDQHRLIAAKARVLSAARNANE